MANVAFSQNPRVKAHGVVIRTAFAAIALLQFVAMYNLQAHASDGPFDEFPFLVHCEVNGANHVFYLSKIGPDGAAVYVSHERLAGTITIGGKAEPVGGSGAGSCSGKTLEQLRSAGQAYDLQH